MHPSGTLWLVFVCMMPLLTVEAKITCNTIYPRPRNKEIGPSILSGIGLVASGHEFIDTDFPYIIKDGEFSSAYRSQIKRAMHKIEQQSCIRFHDVTKTGKPHTFSVISNKDGECYWVDGHPGHISMDPDQCDFGTILHELMHALGFKHEHTRADRDKYIEMKWNRMQDDCTAQYKIRGQDTVDSFTPYDFDSIMHYDVRACRTGWYSFWRMVTMNIKVANVDQDRLGQGSDLSELDRLKLNRFYKCYENLPECHDHVTNCREMLIEKHTGIMVKRQYDFCSWLREIPPGMTAGSERFICAKTCGQCRCVIRDNKVVPEVDYC